MKGFCIFFFFFTVLLPLSVYADCTCESETEDGNRGLALKLKLVAIASIFTASMIGVLVPILGQHVPALRPDTDIFFIIKAFAAGVILATGFIHVLPDAFENLTSPCLNENPWGKFPFTGLVAMMAAIGTLMADSFATGYFKRHAKRKPSSGDAENVGEHEGDIQVHTHATHGHAHGSGLVLEEDLVSSEFDRHRVVSTVLVNYAIN